MTRRLESLQSMRLFAALGVFLYHFFDNYLDVQITHPGTDFFILLVGAVAAVSQAPRIPEGRWRRYIWGRYSRLYVTFVPVFVLYLLAGRGASDVAFEVKSFFLLPFDDRLPLVPQTWMVSNFLVFYWLFSVAFLFRSERVLIPIFLAWAAGCLLFNLAFQRPLQHDEYYALLFDDRNLEFLLGYLAGKTIAARRVSATAAARAVTVGLLAVAAVTLVVNEAFDRISGDVRVVVYGLPLTVVIVGMATLEQHRSSSRLLRCVLHPVLVWMGGASYVLFLLHGFLMRAWHSAIAGITLIQLPVLVVAVSVISALVYQFWEKPVLAFLRGKTLPQRA